MLWTIYECLLNLYQGFLFTWFIHKILIGKRYEPAAFWFCSILTALALTSYTFFPMPTWDTWIFVFVFLYTIIFFRDDFLKKAFWFAILLVISGGTAGITLHIAAYIIKKNIDVLLSFTIYRLIFTLLINALFYIVFTVIIKLYKREQSHPHHITALLVVNILCTVLIDLFFSIQADYDLPAKWLFAGCGLTLLIGGLTVYIYYILNNYSTQILNFRIQEKILDSRNAQIEELQTMYSKMLKLQHDMNSYIKDLKDVSETNPQKYLKLLEAQWHPLPSTGNPVLDSVISIKYYKMEEHRIEFRGTNLHYTGGMNISEVTLCSLLSNMLDNAIEYLVSAEKQLPERYIYLGFSYSAAGLMIICENPIAEEIGKVKIFSSKKTEPGHGLGMVIMNKIAEDAKGQIDFISHDAFFRVLAYIPKSKSQEEELIYHNGH